MSIYSEFGVNRQPCEIVTVDRRNPLGVVQGDHYKFDGVVDVGLQMQFAAQPTNETDDVLIYTPVTIKSDTRTRTVGQWAVGCQIIVHDTAIGDKTYRISRFDVARDIETNKIDHIELYGEEIKTV